MTEVEMATIAYLCIVFSGVVLADLALLVKYPL